MMERVVLALALVFAVTSSTYGLTETFEGSGGKVTVDNGQVGIGEITGGSFGPGSFSIAGPGGVSHGLPANPVQHGGPIIINPPNNGQRQDNLPPQNGEDKKSNSGGGNFWYAGQNDQVYPQRAQAKSEHREFGQVAPSGGRGGQGGFFQGSQGVGFQGGLGGGFQGSQGAAFYPAQGGQGVAFQGGQGGGFVDGQGATFRPGQEVTSLPGHRNVQVGQGASFRPDQGGSIAIGSISGGSFEKLNSGQRVRGGQGSAFQIGQGVTSLPGHRGLQAGQGVTLRPVQADFQAFQGGSLYPDQGGNIAIGSITGGTFEGHPNLVKNSRNTNTGVNIGHGYALSQQSVHGYSGNSYEEFSDESSYSAESAEESEPWVWYRR